MIYSKSTKDKVMKKITISLLISLILGAVLGFGGTYAYFKTNTHTSLKYGENKAFEEDEALELSSVSNFKTIDIGLDENIQEFIYLLCDGYDIDYSFVLALIDQESNFTINAVSNTGDYGLFQINEINHDELKNTLGIKDISDPYENTRAGMFILRKLFEKYEEPAKVLMAYNMGETGAKILWDKGVFSTTYTDKVLKLQNKYEKELEK